MSKNKRDEKGSIENAKTNHETIRNEKTALTLNYLKRAANMVLKAPKLERSSSNSWPSDSTAWGVENYVLSSSNLRINKLKNFCSGHCVFKFISNKDKN